MKPKVSLSWSGGKDACLALYKVLLEDKYEVVSLHTSIDYKNKKVGLHGIHEDLLSKQAKLLNIPLEKIYLNEPGSPLSYEDLMVRYYTGLKKRGVEKIISGDLYLSDLRKYKENLALKSGLEMEFPLWGIPTKKIISDFLESGFKTVLCAVDDKFFTLDDAGKILDRNFLQDLNKLVDPCGENGEFHTFVFEGPLFSEAIKLQKGTPYSESYTFSTEDKKEVKSTFHYIELIA